MSQRAQSTRSKDGIMLRRRPGMQRMERSRIDRINYKVIGIGPKESPRDKSKERERDKSKERERDKSKERERDKSKDRETDKSQEKEKDGERDKSKDREKEKASTAETEGAEKGHAIRTRLSTGSIHMNGTTTISVAREIENNQRLLGKIADDIPVVPQSTTNRKRSAGAEGLQVPAGGSVPPKRRKIGRNDGSGEDNRNDYFCWLCHKEGTVICCELCPRVYHAKCLELSSNLPKDWACPECEKILRAECIDTRSKSMAMISIDTLCTLLKYALERMQHQGSDPFTKPVDLSNVPYYTDYIFNPMDLSQLERNIKKKMYGCTEAFLADAKWILHNCIIFNGTHHKLTSSAKMIIKICKHEMNEIELCPDCYWNSCIRKNDEWFSETCRTPHTLVWAKLKGYPFWPAKALREMDDQVDVRFFGAHDRSWVSTSQVYMLSKDIPTPAKNKKGGFENAMDELDIHIEKLKEKFGSFQYAPFRTPYDKNHVYFHNKMKQPFRKKGKQPASPKGKAFETRQIGTQVKPKFSLKRPSSDLDKQSMASKTATAVKSKYSSIISTRRAGTVYLVEVPVKKIPVSPDAKSDIVVTEVKDESVKIEDQSEKIESSVGQVSKIVSAPVQVRNEQGTPVLNKEVKSRPSIVDKLQDKIKLMQESEEHEEEEEKENDETNISQVVENPKEVDGGGAQSQNVEFPEPSENTTKEDKDHTSVNVRKEVDDKSEVVKDCSSDRKTSDVLQSATAEEVVQADNKQMDTSDTNDCEKSSESLMEVGSDVSPSKKLYLDNLAKTIQSCKAKLGIPGEKEITDDDALLEESDDDEEEEMEAMEVKEKDDSSKDKEIIKGDNQMEVTSADNNKEEKKSNKEEKNESDDVNSIVKEDKDSTGSTSCDEIKDVASKNSDVSATSSDRETQDVTNNDRETEGVKLDEKKDKNCTETKTNEIVKDDDKSLSTESVSTGTSTEMLKEIGETKKVDVKCQDLKPSDKGLDEPALLMEVESESDSDRLVIDMESDEGLHTIAPSKNISSMIKKASQEKETVADNSKVLKPTEQVQIIGKAGKLYEIIVDKSKSTVNSMDTKQDRQKKPLTAAVKRKSSSDTRQLSSEFFQSAVEKTMRAPEQQTTKKLPEVKAVMLNKVVSKPTSSLDKTQGQVEDVSPSSSSSSSSPSTSKPGSHSEIITKFTKKLMSSIQETFEEMCNEFISTELQPKNITKNLQSEIQKMEWEQQQQVLELKHNFQLTMSEMKACWEAEKQRIVSEVNAMCGKDKEKAIEDTKKKQWCANCGKEAIFYCCWNTSYCDYPCQQAHWPQHMPNCMQSQQQLTTDTESPEKNGQPSSSTASASSADRQMNSQETGSVQQQKTGSTPGVQQGGVDNPVEMDNTLTPSPVRDHVPVGISRQDDQRPRYQYLVGQPGLQPSPAMGLQQAVPIIGGQGNMNMQPMGTGFTPIQPSLGPNQESVSKRKPGCYNWTEQQMDSACNAILTGGMSVNKAAKVYNVPRVRLAERVSGKPVTLPPNTQPMMTGAQQPIIQYVQPPQPVLSLPPPGVQQFASPPQVGMQTIVQGHPSQAGMVQNRPVVQQNQSVLFPLQVRPHQQPVNVTGGIMPGNIVFTQAGPRSNNPFQVPGRF